MYSYFYGNRSRNHEFTKKFNACGNTITNSNYIIILYGHTKYLKSSKWNGDTAQSANEDLLQWPTQFIEKLVPNIAPMSSYKALTSLRQ